MNSAQNGSRPCPVELEEFDSSIVDTTEAIGLPRSCYTSEDFFEFEKDAIFLREWFCVGRADQIPSAGDYRRVDFAGEPLVVVRHDSSEIVVMSAVCRHRAALIAEGTGNCGRNLRCPYHWWTYDLSGKLVSSPGMGETHDFDHRRISLPRLRVEIWNGFIFANFDPDAEPLAPRLTNLDEVLANYQTDALGTSKEFVYDDLPFNWKIMVENGVEHYHAVFLHNRYVPRSAKDAIISPWNDENAALVSIVPLPAPDIAINASGRESFWPIETLTPEERERFVFAVVPPNLLIQLESDLVSWFIILPLAADKLAIRWCYSVPAATASMRQFDDVVAAVHQGIEVFNKEDFPINSAMQRGLGSRFTERNRFSVEEETTVQFARWLVKRYRRQDEQARATPHKRSPVERGT